MEEDNIKCQRCKRTIVEYCDNDCGTYHCIYCNLEFYIHDNNYIITHNPKCNNIDDTDDDNDNNVQDTEDYYVKINNK